MSSPFLSAIETRRSVYGLTNSSPIPDQKVVDIVKTAITNAPSSFNVQSARAVVVFGEEQLKVWDLILAAIQEDKPNLHGWAASFRGAYGSVCIIVYLLVPFFFWCFPSLYIYGFKRH